MDKASIEEIRNAIKNKYVHVANAAAGYFKYPTGKEGLQFLGYDDQYYANYPEPLVESFCGVGNPFAMEPFQSGVTVLDIGCGAGFDVIYASHLVGDAGRVYGIDLTSDMVEKAKNNIQQLRILNADVQEGLAEDLPFPNETIDVVTSNGVFNLSPQKERVFAEVFRVLKNGGRLQFADIMIAENVSKPTAENVDSWSN